MVFVADDLAAWLIGLIADAGRKKLSTLILGTVQERALRSVAAAAVLLTAQDLRPGDDKRAEQVALVISQVFSKTVLPASLSEHETLLEALQTGIAGQLAVLDDVSLTGTGRSSADLLGVPAAVLADKLTSHVLREILVRGAHGGPLTPLADQLNHDVAHLQGQRIEDMLRRLDNDVREALDWLDVTRSTESVSTGNNVAGHVFISYVHEDSYKVGRLQQMLESAGIPVWRDTANLWPGEDWRAKIRHAISDNALVFIACFSRASLARRKSFQNEELALAIEQLRLRPPEEPWLIPVRFDDCEIPDRDIGAGRTLTSIQRADLFGDRLNEDAARLTAVVLRILGLPANVALLRILELIKDREDLYTYVKRQETRREMTGDSSTVPIPEAYSRIREVYHDLNILSGPDGYFPVAVFNLAPEVESDLEVILSRQLPSRQKPILEPRIIRTIKDRGSDIWNGNTFSLAALNLDPEGRAASIDTYLGSYYDMVCSANYLEYELLDALRQMAGRPLSLDLLPVRRQALALYPNPDSCLRAGGGVDAVIAISTLVVYRRDGKYWIMSEVRSKKVAEYGDLYHVIPSFIFQPVVAPTPYNLEVEWSIQHNIYREYLEELFNVPEAQQSGGAVDPQYFYNNPNLQYLRRLLAIGTAELRGVAFIFNLLNHRPELCTLLLIRDQEWYENQRFSDPPIVTDPLRYLDPSLQGLGPLRHLNLNDEFMVREHHSDRPHLESVTTLPLFDEHWAEIARPWLMVPPGAPALILGARAACKLLNLAEPRWLLPFSIDHGTE
jgi:hypothetical protein